MKYTKLNRNWNAEPNAPDAKISLMKGGIELSFLLDPLQFEHIDEGDIGKVAFDRVHAYRWDSTTDAAYAQGQFRFKNDQLPWGEFYELKHSKWKSDFPADKIVVDALVDQNEIRHFIFFFKDKTFECLATDCHFWYDNGLADTLEDKYPKGYLNHYLSMFASQFDKPSIDNFRIYTDLYIQMEGKKEFADLKSELKNIKKNNDLNLYMKYANSIEVLGFGKKQLDELVKVIEKHKV